MLGFTLNPQKRFAELGEREILALAITLEEEDGRIYRDFAEGLREAYPASAKVFDDMAEEESGHRRMLIDLYRERFGEHIPLVRREDVRGFVRRKPIWLTQPLGLEAVRRRAEELEQETANFYREAAKQVSDAEHPEAAGRPGRDRGRPRQHRAPARGAPSHRNRRARARRKIAHRAFVLQYVQPGLAGLMDGSVSTLAPLFAAAFATGRSWDAFLVGLAASIGAGISMGFAEALSDDGSITGRGHPWMRGLVCGLMTTLGGIGHTLPFLIPNFHVATTLAVAVVLVELWAIAWVRARYMDTPFLQAAFQVVLGGVLVFVTGILIGSA